jgi:Fe-S-cluster-containing hydrogenase component 2
MDPTKCRGCRRCELACSFAKEGEFDYQLSRIHVVIPSDFTYPVQIVCQHCDVPLCLFACPVNAITKNNENGAVILDAEKCIGCLSCYIACPLGGISLHPVKKLPIKCDLCGGDPQCVAECPYEALVFVELTESLYPKKLESVEFTFKEFGKLLFARGA